ncbi:MAG: hypothetical protein IJ770_00935 [Alphaproteobacteria bacterium]|nr:hypothetical protein [Alphaproteobacteria bacterium]
MIIEEQNFRIKKITETDKDWLLYPKDSDKPIKLPKAYVYGNLPPVRKFFWQTHTLQIKKYADIIDFIAYAEMDGLILFDIPEEDYPQDVKQKIAHICKIEQEFAQMQQEYTDSLKTQLTEYLSRIPNVKELEDEIGKLPVCWRAYLKMLLPMQYRSTDSLQRLTLMYWLITIANRIYKRHIDTESSISVVFSLLRFAVNESFVQWLSDTMVEEMENNPKFADSDGFLFFQEVRNELNRILPPMPKRLEVYLTQVICRLLSAYSDDFSELELYRNRSFSGTPLSSDSQAYGYLRQQMKLLKFSSLIVEKQFTDEEIAKFSQPY